MRMSQIFAPTLREVPSEADIPSHQLMLRAGMIRKAVSGVYSYLHLGCRVVRKIEEIVREEMDRQGAQEVLMPAIQSADIWRETGRWDDYGNEMFRLKDRHGREMCLGPTHEEIVTVTVRDEIRSYRQLPKILYQIQTKYRDEIRPRFGVMRSREFIMKDAYSFDRDNEGLDSNYSRMYEAYRRVFSRCGVDYRVVEADAGAIGGSQNHEFMVVSEVGEDALVFCDACGYGANVERAESARPPERDHDTDKVRTGIRKVSTPGMRTVEEVTSYLQVGPSKLLKTLLYMADGEPVAAVIRGDRDLNEAKLKRTLGVRELELASPEIIERVSGAPVGFTGPVGLREQVKIVADWEAVVVEDAVVGANAADAHLAGANYGVDYSADIIADIRNVVAGDACPRCGAELRGARGVEVGHLFKLGTKYSSALGVNYLDEGGVDNPVVMGCYGIGITRTAAAIIEAHHDDDGIIWPMSVAPYQVLVMPLNTSENLQVEVAERIYSELGGYGVEVVIDDRDERPGVKFKDADLIGFPIRVIVGPKHLGDGKVEVSMRSDGGVELVEIDNVAAHVTKMVDRELSALMPH